MRCRHLVRDALAGNGTNPPHTTGRGDAPSPSMHVTPKTVTVSALVSLLALLAGAPVAVARAAVGPHHRIGSVATSVHPIGATSRRGARPLTARRTAARASQRLPPVTISPLEGTLDASPSTQISFLGLPAASLSRIVVVGSRSGRHAGGGEMR